ncbi:MAG: class I SAM-dependent methyltransferase [Sphingomonadales bacterium]|nr:class I SAM-dependent methyltransferase [Sphingomonadales bacterium]
MSLVKFASAVVMASVALSSVPALAAKKSPKPAATVAPALDPATSQLLDAAIAGQHRSAEEKARDVYRHPREALAFYGLNSTMTVIEVSPGAGWWTELLAPLLRDSGKLQVALNTNLNGGGRRGLGDTLVRYAAAPKVYDKVELINYAPSLGTRLGVDGGADMVLVFRHMHGLIGSNLAPQALKLYFDALKPGGVLAIEQHRWPDALPYPDRKEGWEGVNSGYIKEADVIALATAAGFKLVGKSEVNANPKDTRDHPRGVWNLPPVLRDGAVDKDKYLAIGESDRMTLKFVKPTA